MNRKIVGGIAAVALAFAQSGLAQAHSAVQTEARPASVAVSALMVSDLHFDPFRDPAKVPALAQAPVEDWDRILHEPASLGQAAAYAALESACKARGEDTDLPLFDSALAAAQSQAAGARFVTVSGDLLVHQFECRYRQLSKGPAQDLTGFAQKTVSYVVRRVQAAFPSAAVYVAVGNNDSGCGDYAMDENDRFLAGTGAAVEHGWRGATDADRQAARLSYRQGGHYTLPLPGVARTRLLVINTTYLSNKYTNCAGEKESSAGRGEIAWLQFELERARARGESVWVLGHMPPGVDIYSTLRHLRTMCTAASETFLAHDDLARTLEDHADVVRLGIFGHTHTDEFRLLGKVPIKLVGSLTPINGNTPSFTFAQIGPATAILDDYTVFTAPNATGLATAWTREYSFRQAYGAKDFSAPSLRELIATFRAKPGGPASAEYQRDFYGGEGSPLPLVWPQYVCALDHGVGPAFQACLCP